MINYLTLFLIIKILTDKCETWNVRKKKKQYPKQEENGLEIGDKQQNNKVDF